MGNELYSKQPKGQKNNGVENLARHKGGALKHALAGNLQRVQCGARQGMEYHARHVNQIFVHRSRRHHTGARPAVSDLFNIKDMVHDRGVQGGADR